MTSFLTFSNGKTRTVQMKGKRVDSSSHDGGESMRLNLTGDGPIYVLLCEVPPSTILLNEIEIASGKIVLSSSLSITDNGDQLVQVAHEMGSKGGKAARAGEPTVEGYQIWRLKKKVKNDERESVFE